MEGLHSISNEEKNEGSKYNDNIIISRKVNKTPIMKNSYVTTSVDNDNNNNNEYKLKELVDEDNDIDVPKISSSFSATVGLTVAALFISIIVLLAVTGKNWDFRSFSDSTIVSPKTSMNYDKSTTNKANQDCSKTMIEIIQQNLKYRLTITKV